MLIQGKNSNISHVLNHLNIGKDVDGELLKTAFKELFTRKDVIARDTQLGAILSGIMAKTPSVEEVTSLINVALSLDSFQVIDLKQNITDPIICVAGSGKKGVKTINISTPASIVAASAGAFVVKPGSHSTSSVTGSSDFMISLGLKIKDVHSTIEVLKNTGLGFFSIEDLIPTFDSVYGKKIFAPNPLSFGLAALVCPVKYTKLVYGLSHYNIKLSASVLSNFGIRDAIISTCTDDHLRYIDEFGLFKHNYYLFLKDSSVGEVQKMNPIQEIGVPPYSTNGCLLC